MFVGAAIPRKYGIFSGPYFLMFSPNMEKWEPEKVYLNNFHVVISTGYDLVIYANMDFNIVSKTLFIRFMTAFGESNTVLLFVAERNIIFREVSDTDNSSLGFYENQIRNCIVLYLFAIYHKNLITYIKFFKSLIDKNNVFDEKYITT